MTAPPSPGPGAADASRAGPEVASLVLAEDPERWAAAGFAVDADGTCRLGQVTLELAGTAAGAGLLGWALRALPAGAPADLDGFPTDASDRGAAEPADHPCSAVAVDHVVLLSDDLDRTVAAAAPLGLAPRRWRPHRLPDGTEATQVFFRAGQVVLEVVGPPSPPARPRPGVRPFGLALTVADLERAREAMGHGLGATRPAVQAGRLIATASRTALGLTTALALMTPPPQRGAPTAPDQGRDA